MLGVKIPNKITYSNAWSKQSKHFYAESISKCLMDLAKNMEEGELEETHIGLNGLCQVCTRTGM